MSDSTESAAVTTDSPAAAVSSAPDSHASLGAEVDAMFGYRVPATTTSQEPDDASSAGEAPSSPSSESSENADAAAPTQPEQAGATPAEAGRTTDATQPASTDPTDDPLKDATPLTYTVSGQQRSDERIKVVNGLGAFIDPKDLPHIQQRLSERDHLYETSREQHARAQSLEKLTEWSVQGADGKPQVLTGAPAIEASRVFIAQSTETIKELASVLKPENIDKYVEIAENEQGLFLRWNQGALNALRERLQFVTDRAGFNERKRFSEFTPTTASAPSATPQADTPVESLASDTVSAIAGQLSVTLTDDAKAFLAAQLPRYVRATTDAEKPQFGARIVDASFATLVQREAKQAQTTARVAETASTANSRNAPKLAAAMIGRKPAPAAPSRPTPRTDTDEPDDEETAYLRFEKAGAAALRARSA